MPKLLVISHPEVTIDPGNPITEWPLSAAGRARAEAFALGTGFANVTHIWTSAERKARNTAEILCAPRNLPVQIAPLLGENDRSATGFLAAEAFEAAADQFFAQPEASFRGWETAHDAQGRIAGAVSAIIAGHSGGDLAIVTHGAVGTLLWCAWSERPIDRVHDQPGQGHYWQADLATRRPEFSWRSIT